MDKVSERRRPGRPRSGEASLTRDQILRAALRIVDIDGVDALTMRRLGKELGVNPMSIYHHLPGKAAVLSGLVQVVFSAIPATDMTAGSWQQRVKAAARAMRTGLAAHRNLALQVVTDPGVVADAQITVAEPIYAALETAGASPLSAVDAVNTIVDFLRGSLIAEAAAPPEGFDLGPSLHDRLRALPAGTAPALARVVDVLGADGLAYDFDAGFDAGLDLLIAGIEAGLHSPPRPEERNRS
jgi:TetR/AcrR family transcriptional regulator, tetracycline repressor protein